MSVTKAQENQVVFTPFNVGIYAATSFIKFLNLHCALILSQFTFLNDSK